MKVALYDGNVIMDAPAAQWLADIGVPSFTSTVKGRLMASVPHTLEAVRLFRNAGMELPTPMKANGYVFPGRFPPYLHQLDTADFLAGYEKAFCLSSPGTGKTAAAIWAADYLMQQGVVRRVLVLCPLSCMQSVWGDELFGIVPSQGVGIMHGSTHTRRKVLDSGSPWLIMNHDGVKVQGHNLIGNKSGIDLVIVDEATAFKSMTAARTKALFKICEGKRVWAMTGTPIPQDPTDAFAMAKLVNPNAPQHMYQFRDMTMRRVTQFKWMPKDNAIDKVYEVLQPAIRYDKADCLDMPEVVKTVRNVALDPAQKAAMDEIRKEWVADVGGTVITTANAAVRMGKLMQIAQGMVIDNDGEPHILGASARLQACVDIVAESDSKTIVFVPYRASMGMVAQHLAAAGYSVAQVNGDTSPHERDMIFKNFQQTRDPQVLVAHPKTTSHGLTLTAASTTIWYGPVFSAETYEQANNRTDRPGQRFDMRIVHLCATVEEKRVYDALTNNVNVQGTLLDLYKRNVEKDRKEIRHE